MRFAMGSLYVVLLNDSWLAHLSACRTCCIIYRIFPFDLQSLRHRATLPNTRPAALAQSPAAKPLHRPAGAAAAQPSPDALGRRSPYAPLRPSPEAAKSLKTPQLSFVSDDSAMEVPLSRRSAGGNSGSPLVQPQVGLQVCVYSHSSLSMIGWLC